MIQLYTACAYVLLLSGQQFETRGLWTAATLPLLAPKAQQVSTDFITSRQMPKHSCTPALCPASFPSESQHLSHSAGQPIRPCHLSHSSVLNAIKTPSREMISCPFPSPKPQPIQALSRVGLTDFNSSLKHKQLLQSVVFN